MWRFLLYYFFENSFENLYMLNETKIFIFFNMVVIARICYYYFCLNIKKTIGESDGLVDNV